MTLSCITCRAELQDTYRSCPACGDQISDFLRAYRNALIEGKYHLVSRLGKGGMGEVYRARHVHFDADRVIKVMNAELLGREDMRVRFQKEAQVAQRVHSANVARVYDVSRLPDGSMFMVWEFIDGIDLRRLLRKGALPTARVLRIAQQVLAGLSAIHEAGLVHRDISPDNIMLRSESEQAVIIDFGVAKDLTGDSTVGDRGAMIGKYRYASPEQLVGFLRGQRIDSRSDLYSFGIVLYEMLAGVVPFDASTATDLVRMQVNDPPPPIEIEPSGVAPELRASLMRSLAKDRDKRHSSAAEFAQELHRIAARLAPAEGTPSRPVEKPAVTPLVDARTAITSVTRVTADWIVSELPRVLRDIEQTGAVYAVTAGAAEDFPGVIQGLLNSANEVTFVLGRPSLVNELSNARVDPEYGWPERVDVKDIKSIHALMPSWRRHPVICRNGQAVASSISWEEHSFLAGHRSTAPGDIPFTLPHTQPGSGRKPAEDKTVPFVSEPPKNVRPDRSRTAMIGLATAAIAAITISLVAINWPNNARSTETGLTRLDGSATTAASRQTMTNSPEAQLVLAAKPSISPFATQAPFPTQANPISSPSMDEPGEPPFTPPCATANACYEVAKATHRAAMKIADKKTAVRLFERACEFGSVDACVAAMREYQFDGAMGYKIPPLRALFERACELGKLNYCSSAAGFYAEDNPRTPTRSDIEKAVRLHKKGCDAGDAHGCWGLGELYEGRPNIMQDAAMAFTLFSRACELQTWACTAMAYKYLHGKGIPKNEESAIELFRTGCGHGSPPKRSNSCEEATAGFGRELLAREYDRVRDAFHPSLKAAWPRDRLAREFEAAMAVAGSPVKLYGAGHYGSRRYDVSFHGSDGKFTAVFEFAQAERNSTVETFAIVAGK
jgi:serine/threonine protein kinase